MRPVILIAILLTSSLFATAQADNNSLTVTASRTLSPVADQAVYNITIYSGPDQTADRLSTALAQSGIPQATFIGLLIGTAIPNPQLQWTFSITGPLTDIKTTLQSLAAAKVALAKTNPALNVTVGLASTQVSAQAAQSLTCPIENMFAEVKAKAQALAAASGRFVSGTIGLATSTSPGQTQCAVTAKFSLVG